MEALAVAALAVLTGTSDSVHAVASLDELAEAIDLSHVSHHAAKFDAADLAILSARTLHNLPFEAVSERLAALGVTGDRAEAFWLAVRGNLTTLGDAREWAQVCFGQDLAAMEAPAHEDAEFLAAAAKLLPEEPFGAETWRGWTESLKAKTGRKGKLLFHPLRLALTGREKGPELAALLPLIGRAKALARLGASA